MELGDRQPQSIEGIVATAYLVNHGGPFFSYRLECENKVISYSGDTEWSDALLESGRDADIFSLVLWRLACFFGEVSNKLVVLID